MAKFVEIGGTWYNKTKFGNKWTEIVKSHQVGVKLSGDSEIFILDACSKLDRFKKILDRGKVELLVTNKSFNGKRVKGLVLVTPNSKYHVWVSKSKVVGVLFPKALSPDISKVNRKNVLKALRGIIEPQIKQFRDSVKGQTVVKSAVSGKPVLGAYHVDHVYPFIRLVEEWCRENEYDLETIEVACRGVCCKLKDSSIAESWFDYHLLNAKLQVLDASENTKKGSRYFG